MSKPPEEQQRSSEETENLLKAYNELLNDSKISAAKTTEQLTAFSSIRNAVVSMEIKTSGGEKLLAPLFDSALLNFPAEGTNEHESHLLTSLSFLILSGTRSEQWKIQPKNPSESTKITKKTEIKTEGDQQAGKESKEKPNKKDKIEGNKTESKDSDPKKLNEHVSKGARGARQKTPFSAAVKTDKFSNKSLEHEKKPFHTNAPQQACFTPDKFHRNTNRQQTYHAPIQPPILPRPNTFRVPEPPPPILPINPSTVYHVPPPTIMPPPSIPLHNKKAFLVLAVNGKQYGKIVIELRSE